MPGRRSESPSQAPAGVRARRRRDTASRPHPTFDAVAVRRRREQMLLRLLLRSTHRMNAEMAKRIRTHGHPDFQPSFTALLAHIDTEGTRIGAVAERMGTSRQAVSQLLQSIESLGYVERVADPVDARAVIVRHTTSGRKLLVTAIDVMTGIELEYAEILGEAPLAQLKRLLTRLLDRADPKGALGRS